MIRLKLCRDYMLTDVIEMLKSYSRLPLGPPAQHPIDLCILLIQHVRAAHSSIWNVFQHCLFVATIAAVGTYHLRAQHLAQRMPSAGTRILEI